MRAKAMTAGTQDVGPGDAAATARQVADLPRRTDAELAALWASVAGRTPLPAQRGLLVRELAYRLQAGQHGGLDAAARRLLARAVRDLGAPPGQQAAPATDATPAARGEPSRTSVPGAARRPHGDASAPRVRTLELSASARLVRVWPAGGTRHEVLVLEGGNAFEYRGRRYTSLTPIAREITGTHWSGPRFFGLTVRTGRKAATGSDR